MSIPRDKPIPALLEFIATWVPDLSTQHRIAASAIPAFVPPPLRAIYELAGNWPIPYAEQWRPPYWHSGLFGAQDHLLPIDRLVVNENHFKFIHENQGVWSCETLINESDPPVFSDSSVCDGNEEGMQEVCPSLSHFLATFCLQELAFGSRHVFCVDSEVNNPGELVKNNIKELWIDGIYAYQGLTYSFYLCDHELMIMNTPLPGGYWLAFNNESCSALLSAIHKIRRIH